MRPDYNKLAALNDKEFIKACVAAARNNSKWNWSNKTAAEGKLKENHETVVGRLRNLLSTDIQTPITSTLILSRFTVSHAAPVILSTQQGSTSAPPKPTPNYKQLDSLSDDQLYAACLDLAEKNRGLDFTFVSPKAPDHIKTNHANVVRRLRKWLGPDFTTNDGPIGSNDILRRFRHRDAGRHDFMAIWQDRQGRRATPVTSDHTMVSNEFRFQHRDQTSLKPFSVSTWNLMNKGHSKLAQSRQAYANTPEIDLDESAAAYQRRKEQQIAIIIDSCSKGSSDAMFLQEIDFLTIDEPFYKALALKLKGELQKIGYDIIIGAEDNSPQKTQAIIYNKHKFNYIPGSARAINLPDDDGKQIKRAPLLQAQFRYQGQVVSLISAHLDFESSYRYALLDYSKRMAAKSMVVWGGDTNHSLGQNIQGLVGDYRRATNYDIDESEPGQHTTNHAGGKMSKSYDGFGACPPADWRVQIVEKPGQCFQSDSEGRVSIQDFTLQHSHQSLFGHPWCKQQHWVLEVLNYRDLICQQYAQRFCTHVEVIRNSFSKYSTVQALLENIQRLQPHCTDVIDQLPAFQRASLLLSDTVALQHELDQKTGVVTQSLPPSAAVTMTTPSFRSNDLHPTTTMVIPRLTTTADQVEKDEILKLIQKGANHYLEHNPAPTQSSFFQRSGTAQGRQRAIDLNDVINKPLMTFADKISATITAIKASSDQPDSLRKCILNALNYLSVQEMQQAMQSTLNVAPPQKLGRG